MFAWLWSWRRVRASIRPAATANASGRSVAIAGDNINSPIGLNEEQVGRVLEETLDRKLSAISRAKGVPEAPLRAVLKKLGETRVPRAEIADRLANAADELLRLRADLTRLRNDRPEFAAIRARAAALIDSGEFDAARATLNEGRIAARALREEMSSIRGRFSRGRGAHRPVAVALRAACAKFVEAANLDPSDCWIWIELGDLWTIRGSLGEAEKAFFAARMIAATNGDDRDLSVSVRESRRRAGGAGRPRRRAEILPRQPRDQRPAGEIRSRQRRLAARSVGVVRQGRRRAGGAGRPRRRAEILPATSLAICRPAGEIRSRQCRLAARSLGVVQRESATCRRRRATSPAR